MKYHVAQAAVGIAELCLVDLHSRLLQKRKIGGVVGVGKLSRPDLIYRLADQFLAFQAAEGLKGSIAAEVASLDVLVEDGTGDRVDHLAYKLAVGRQRLARARGRAYRRGAMGRM